MGERRTCRFFVRQQDLRGRTALLTEEESHHLQKVLGLKKSDRVILFDGAGNEFAGRVSRLGERVEVILDRRAGRLLAGAVSISLAQALPKKRKMDFVVEKACELGLRELIPVESERTVLRIPQASRARVMSRWQKIMTQTCKQCELDWIPHLHPLVSFRELLGLFKNYDVVLLPHPDSRGEPVSQITQTLKTQLADSKSGKKILILIGPEGGFSDREIEQAKDRGARLVYLGELVLKTETAAIVASALIKYGVNA